MFTPFAFVKSSAVAINPVATTWATTAGITNTSVISAVSTFVDTLQAANIWSKMIVIYPMITDSNTSSTAKTQFTYNLVNPSTYTATYFGTGMTGAKGGYTNGGDGNTFVLGITPATLGNNYTYGYYTNTSAVTTADIDMGVYDDAGGDAGYSYCISGRNLSGGNAQILMAASDAIFPYNVTGTGPFTGLFGVGGNSTTGYAYRRTSQLGTAANYDNNKRGNNWNIGLGSLYWPANNEALNASTKTYQFCFGSTFLDTTQFGDLANAVNTLQGSIDAIFSTTRKAY